MRLGKRTKKGRKDGSSIPINECIHSLTYGYGTLAIFQKLLGAEIQMNKKQPGFLGVETVVGQT